MKVRLLGTIVVMSVVLSAAACSQPPQQTAPPVEQPADELGPLGADRIRADQIRTRHLMNGSITSGKLAFKAVAVTVLAAAATGSSAADTDLAGGALFGCHANSNQDQHVDNVVLNANGSITVTLAANATADNVFRCIAFEPNAKGTF